jgi:DNA-binding CsgD family transcriptional regulator/tetratricopeptide (TPR) repeat protein
MCASPFVASSDLDTSPRDASGGGEERDDRLAIMSAEAPFIGRGAALNALNGAYEQACTLRSTVVLVAGEAGVGKSRLVQEFVACLGDARVVTGACLELGDGAPAYGPFTAALRALAREVGTDRMVELAASGASELAQLLPEFGTPPPQAGSGPTRLFETILTVVERLAEERPLVVVVEDVHWSDRSSRDLLMFLAYNLGTTRAMLVVTCREPHEDGSVRSLSAGLERSGCLVRVELPRLTRREVTAQVAGVLGRRPDPSLVRTVFSRSAGNPLFVRALLASGATAAADPVPRSLRDLLLIPAKRMPAESQCVVREAAVGGTAVGYGLLAAVSRLSEPQLDRALRVATPGVLTMTTDGFAFHHALIRQAVYEELVLPGERVALHRRYAEALEHDPQLAIGSAVAEIAHHWYAAGDAPRALLAAWRAAEESRAMAAHAERLLLLERVLHIWERLPSPEQHIGVDRAEVLWQAVEAADESGELERGMQLAAQTLEVVDPARRPELAARVLERRARMRRKLGQPGAQNDLRAALELIPAEPPSALRAWLLAHLGHRLYGAADRTAAWSVTQEALEMARRIGDGKAEAHTMITLALLDAGNGEAGRAWAGYAAAREIAERVGERMLLTRAGIDEAHSRENLADHEGATVAARIGLLRAREAGLERTLGVRSARNLMESLHSLGRWDEALEAGERATELAPPAAHLAQIDIIRALVLLARGELDAAAETAARLGESGLSYETAMDRFPYVRLLAELHVAREQPAEALAVIAPAFEAHPPAQEPRYGWPVLAAGARAATQLAQRSKAAADEEGRRHAQAAIRQLHKLAASTPRGTPVADAYHATVAAELATGAARRTAWQSAVDAWAKTAQPHPRATALIRSAQCDVAVGDRTAASAKLREGVVLAEDLAAAPLVQAARTMALRAELALDGRRTAPAVREPADRLGLTAREREVLHLIALGRTNRGIAEELYITVKTASVHVSHILTKLGVANRTEAAAVAHQVGLLDEPMS